MTYIKEFKQWVPVPYAVTITINPSRFKGEARASSLTALNARYKRWPHSVPIVNVASLGMVLKLAIAFIAARIAQEKQDKIITLIFEAYHD